MVNGHSASWATQKWSSAGAALEPAPENLPAFGDRRGIDALAGAAPAPPQPDSPPHFVPFGMIEDPYADELAQRSAEFARHAAFDDPTPPQGLPVWNPSPPLVPPPAADHAVAAQQTPEPDLTDSVDPPLAAQLSLGQRFEMAFADEDDAVAAATVAAETDDPFADLDGDSTVLLGPPVGLEHDFAVLDDGFTSLAGADQVDGQGPRFEPLPLSSLPMSPTMPLPPVPLSLPPEQPPSRNGPSLFRPQGIIDPASPDDLSAHPVSPAADPYAADPYPRSRLSAFPNSHRPRFGQVPSAEPPARLFPDSASQAQENAGTPPAGPMPEPPGAEPLNRAHLGPVADPQSGQHVRPMADLQGKPHLGPVADAHGGARLGPVPEPWAPAFSGLTDARGGPRVGEGPDPQARRHLAPVADPVAEPQEPPEPHHGEQSTISREDTGLGAVPGDELPQRVPSHPDVPATVEPTDDAQQPAAPQLSRIASRLRQFSDDLPPAERPVGFDTEAVLEAVRSVAGVRQATIRTTVTGGHHLRLELAEGADPSTISRMVARMLQEQMGLDAALTGPPGRPDEPPLGSSLAGGDGPHGPRIPGQHDPGGFAAPPPVTLPGPRVGAGATPPSTFDDMPPREPRRRHPVSVPRRQPNDPRPPAEFRSPTDFRPPNDFSPTGDTRSPSETRTPGDTRSPADMRSPGDTRSPADMRSPGDTRSPSETRLPGDTRSPGEMRSPGDTRLPGEFRPLSDPAHASGDSRRPGDIRFSGDVRPPDRLPPVAEHPAPGLPPALPTDREQGPRAVIEHVQTSTYGLDATVEVRLTTNGREARGLANGPAVDAYVLRLCAAATAKAVDELLKSGTTTGEAGRCFVEHAAIVPMGSCDVAVVVVLLVCGGWVEQLAGSALVSGDPRRAVVRATLGAVNRRLAALLP